MEYYSDSEYLKHYGILGMKWGVRRFQNPDGSLTASGRKRYLVQGTKFPKDKLIDSSGRAIGLTKDLVLPKGTELNRIAVKYDRGPKAARKGTSVGDREYFSVSYDDNLAWADFMRRYFPSAKLDQITTTTSKDVKIASATKVGAEYAKAAIAVSRSDKGDGSPLYVNNYVKNTIGDNADRMFADIPAPKNKKKATATNALSGSVAMSKAPDSEVYRTMVDSLKKQGYGGAFDYLGTDVATTPVVLFDSKSSTGRRQSTNIGETNARTSRRAGAVAAGALMAAYAAYSAWTLFG